MEFASVFFIELFLPVTIVAYYLLGLIKKDNIRMLSRNIMLLLASLLYYAWSGISPLIIFVGMIAVNFAGGLLMKKFDGSGRNGARKAVLICSVLLDVLLLVFFKYFNMIAALAEILAKESGIGGIFSALLNFEGAGAEGVFRITLPLAISFITFQSISYVADVYTHKTEPTKNPLQFALFMSFFAQVTQGPIMRFGELGPQIFERTHSLEIFLAGLKRFCYGLGKKVLIANVVAKSVDEIFAIEDYSTMGSGIAWLGILLYAIQIYYDFSGYTDMAIGIGGMFGFKISENFNYPYTSLSIQEFWRRWHMSLSFWFRDYIYIPLGGSRVKTGRIFFNLFLVFFVTGIWHGANLTFIVWGLFFALLSILERAFLGNLLKKNPVKPLNWIYTTFMVMMGWVVFRADNLAKAGEYYAQLFSFKPSPMGFSFLSYLNMEVIVALIAGILLMGFLQRILSGFYKKIRTNIAFMSIDTIIQLAVFIWSLILLVGGSYNPSIYGKF